MQNAALKATVKKLQERVDIEKRSEESKYSCSEEHDVLLAAELDEAKELLRRAHGIDFGDYTALVKGSKQFVQMRKTISQKNEQLKQLRKRMLVYEPDDTEVGPYRVEIC